ncbi:Rv3235 family protein [Streptomyces sp. CoH27]|uniref:Rv3235 family protein n=1 Tax=Streptomyces sp. CoH27 TaxID=2875763 RepID=UPI001CD649E9|nr:Rv3235 family protein [Streptomyces sp. CoH27]
MNKVMSRTAQSRPRHRPPTRHDTRRPAGAPPRKPPTRSGRAMTPAALRTPDRPRTASAAAQPQLRPTDLFTDRLVAVLSGQRPVHWMLRHTAGRAYDDLTRLAERSPLRTRGSRPVIHDIGYYVPCDGALEVFARIAAGDQLRALAFRLELGQDLRWRCTAVEAAARSRPTA